jgi:acyl transferase domain-containing protein
VMARSDLGRMSAVRLALMADEARQQALPILRLDPIAIVGMACRAPGDVKTPDALWQLLLAAKTTTREIPADRFAVARWYDADPSAPGKIAAARGSFLDQIDQFDPEYFGIPPREVEQMDPQQRLALEVAIEAIDDAGVPHAALRGSRSGVFMACYHSDYARLVYENVDALDTRSLTGTLHAVTANRISHFLDLRGPSLALDTACSSSLVAIHLACQSLRMGETDFALAGGVSLMITPELFVALSKVGFMAPDGECKTFDAAADGFGRGEGCGMVALKRLSDAVADGDRVLGLIRGSAVNQDGRSTVLTAPNGQAQESMLREALENAALSPERISFVETHGTGTALGDPIEVEALVNVLGGEARAAPCYLGSIKANIGHLEAGAGVMGLIKAVQVLRHGEAPPQPNFHELSPHITLQGSRLKVPTALTPLPPADGPRFASVSSFGVGGTNAHVILEEAPVLPPPQPSADGAVWILPLSAKTPEGLRELVGQWIKRLGTDDHSIEDLCFTATLKRNHYPVRFAVAGRTKAELNQRLTAFDSAATTAVAPKIGFVFSGQGGQWSAMGRGLLESEPVFRATLEACDAAIARTAGWSVLEELQRHEAQSRIAETKIAQPALFALQTALAALWASWGVKPAVVIGHSVGEIAALHVSGALDLEEAARIVVLRGEAMQAATGTGAMAAVGLTQEEARAVAAGYPGRLDLAAVNAPRSTVLSGEPKALEEALAALTARGVTVRPMQVDYAFHSAQMTTLAERFGKGVGAIRSTRPATPMISTLTGAVLDTAVDADYFAKAIREPVRFADAVTAMRRLGVDAIVEIGPHPALAAAISETLDADPLRVMTASLRRARDEAETIRAGLAELYAAGLDPKWVGVQPNGGAIVSLPAYPWHRRRLWLKAARPTMTPSRAEWIGAPNAVAGAGLSIVPLEPSVSAEWMADHRLFGATLFPREDDSPAWKIS